MDLQRLPFGDASGGWRVSVRAIWKATLCLGPSRIAVKLYAAAVDRGVHFRLLHRKDGVPVEQRMVHAIGGHEVPKEETHRGVQVGEGRIVELNETELAGLEPEASRDIEIRRCVPAGGIAPTWFDRPYLLGPDGDGDRFVALVRALSSSGLDGIAHWTMRGKRYQGALCEHEGGLALLTLRSAGSVLELSQLQPPAGGELSTSEVKLARQLVASLTGEFEHEHYINGYAARVEELVRAKQRGEALPLEVHVSEPDDDDTLLESLRASLKRAG